MIKTFVLVGALAASITAVSLRIEIAANFPYGAVDPEKVLDRGGQKLQEVFAKPKTQGGKVIYAVVVPVKRENDQLVPSGNGKTIRDRIRVNHWGGPGTSDEKGSIRLEVPVAKLTGESGNVLFFLHCGGGRVEKQPLAVSAVTPSSGELCPAYFPTVFANDDGVRSTIIDAVADLFENANRNEIEAASFYAKP